MSADKKETVWTRGQLQAAIDDITEQLKGPMPNIARSLLVADRKELREMLNQIKE